MAFIGGTYSIKTTDIFVYKDDPIVLDFKTNKYDFVSYTFFSTEC